MSISIVILTYNEEANLPMCLESIAWCDDIVVLDSFSSDSTITIAKNAGARVVQRKFDNFAGQHNYAIDTIEFKHDWVFHLDADEHFTSALQAECERMVLIDEKSGYQVPNRMLLFGKWLKRASGYPVYQMRFHRLGEVRFEQFGHGQRETGSQRGIGLMREPYDHYSFSKGLFDWFSRHNTYSSDEAEEVLRVLSSSSMSFSSLFCRNPIVRRRALKNISYRLPCRYVWKFVFQYFIKRGFLDGSSGFAYCLMKALYEAQIGLKVKELRRRDKGEPV